MASKNIAPSKAELQKANRQLEKLAFDTKIHNAVQQAAKSKATFERLKADPVKYFTDRRIKIPTDVKVSITGTLLRICIWVCRRFGRYIICIRYCFPVIIFRT